MWPAEVVVNKYLSAFGLELGVARSVIGSVYIWINRVSISECLSKALNRILFVVFVCVLKVQQNLPTLQRAGPVRFCGRSSVISLVRKVDNLFMGG